MGFNAAWYAVLAGIDQLTDLLGAAEDSDGVVKPSIYPLASPANPALPVLIYSRTGAEFHDAMGELGTLTTDSVRCLAKADTIEAAEAIGEALRQNLVGYTGESENVQISACYCAGRREVVFEPQADATAYGYGVELDFAVTHNAAS